MYDEEFIEETNLTYCCKLCWNHTKIIWDRICRDCRVELSDNRIQKEFLEKTVEADFRP